MAEALYRREVFSLNRSALVILSLSLFSFAPALSAQIKPCDLNGDGVVTGGLGTTPKSDFQLAVDMTLGATSCTANIMGLGVCDVVVAQRVVNALPAPQGTGQCMTGINNHSVTLTWVASTTAGVKYKVYRGATHNGPYQLLTTSASWQVSGTTFEDTNAQPGATYYYVVTAVDGSGNESVNSNETSATVPSP
jgi:hypothetical protein